MPYAYRKTMPRDSVFVTDDADTAERERGKGRRVILVGDDGISRGDLIRNWSRLSYRNPAASVCVRDESLADLVNSLCMRTMSNNATGMTRSRAWVTNLLANLEQLTKWPAAMALPNLMHGKIAYIVGAGPSLEKHKHLLPRLWQTGVVFGINSASKHLSCHVQVNIEANDLTPKIDPRWATRVYNIACDPVHFREHLPVEDKGQREPASYLPIWAGEVCGPIERLTRVPRVACSSSATTAAVSLAHRWGCNTIVLVGQDLAYTDGRIYAGTGDKVTSTGYVEWTDEAKTQRRCAPLPQRLHVEMVPAWGDSGEVLSDLGFNATSAWLTSAAKRLSARCINATGGGRHVPGWADMPLASVIPNRHGGSSPSAVLKDAARGMPTLDYATLQDWALTKATDELLDMYAMRDVLHLMAKRRAHPHTWPPYREANETMRHRDDLRAIVKRCRSELQEVLESAYG